MKQSNNQFATTFAAIEELVKKHLPTAEAVVEYKMSGWRVKVRDSIPEGYKGTIDPRYIMFFPVNRRAGITIHFWNPLVGYQLQQHNALLTKAGFKVMVGCAQWNRTAPLPLEPIETILQSAATSIKKYANDS